MSNEIQRKFIGEAVSYQQTRPNYPQELFVALLNLWNQPVPKHEIPVIADIGCGTGIATRGIYYALQEKCKVIGIDPNLSMLKQAKQATLDIENIIYLEGNAEKLPFDTQAIDIVIIAQAMQYFNRPIFYAETIRVLKNSGVIAIIENNRNWKNSQFLEQYEEFLEKNSYDKNLGYYSRDYRVFPFIEELNNYFKDTTETTFLWSKKMTPEDFLGMMKSSTSGQRVITHIGIEEVEHQLSKLIQSHVNKEGLLEVPYISKAYLARNK